MGLKLGSWNIRALLDNNKAQRPHRWTALVAKELSQYNVDIAALCETRSADQGQLCGVGSGYTFYWSGHKEEEQRESSVGFAIRDNLV